MCFRLALLSLVFSKWIECYLPGCKMRSDTFGGHEVGVSSLKAHFFFFEWMICWACRVNLHEISATDPEWFFSVCLFIWHISLVLLLFLGIGRQGKKQEEGCMHVGTPPSWIRYLDAQVWRKISGGEIAKEWHDHSRWASWTHSHGAVVSVLSFFQYPRWPHERGWKHLQLCDAICVWSLVYSRITGRKEVVFRRHSVS